MEMFASMLAFALGLYAVWAMIIAHSRLIPMFILGVATALAPALIDARRRAQWRRRLPALYNAGETMVLLLVAIAFGAALLAMTRGWTPISDDGPPGTDFGIGDALLWIPVALLFGGMEWASRRFCRPIIERWAAGLPAINSREVNRHV